LTTTIWKSQRDNLNEAGMRDDGMDEIQTGQIHWEINADMV